MVNLANVCSDGEVDEVEGFETFGGGLPVIIKTVNLDNKTFRRLNRQSFQCDVDT
jgi:hypothetical protein